MSIDHSEVHLTQRDAVQRLLSDGRWHAHHELAAVGGVRYSARLLELRRLGYEIESRELPRGSGKVYRMPSVTPGARQAKRVKVLLDEHDVLRLIYDGVLSESARAALRDAHGSYDANRGKL